MGIKPISLILVAAWLFGCGSEVADNRLSDDEASHPIPPRASENALWDSAQWKITIPASKNDWYGSGGTTAAELEPSHCASSKDVLNEQSVLYHAPHKISFFDVTGTRAHFRANLGQGTTTTNSNYIRSELRELFNAEHLGSCSTSSSNTSWFVDDLSTGTSQHVLRATLRIEEYPRISGQDPKVIVGQVHGWEIKQALAKMQWDGPAKPVRVILNRDFYKNNQSCTSGTPKYPACEDWSVSVNMGTYAAGEEWQYEIQVDSEGIRLETRDADGRHPVSHDLKWGTPYTNTNNGTVTLTDHWADSDVAYYFKAGIYPQIKPDSSYDGQIFDVSFSNINVEHQ